MTDQEALELGLILAELDSQLKARDTPATAEEAGQMLREIKARRAATKQQPGSAKPWEAKPFTEETRRKVREMEEREREFLARKNPKGVPVIFPGYD